MTLADQDALKQRLRMQRLSLAGAFSVLYALVLVVFHVAGKVDRETLEAAWALVAGLLLMFFGLFRSGLNLRFRDHSLTAYQVLAAVFTMLFVLYRAPETRLLFAAFFFVALMFGMLRSNARQLIAIGSVSLAAYAIVTWARYRSNGDQSALVMDVLESLVIATTFPGLVFLGSRVKRLREADRRKDDFLATLAHELRNPLAPIQTGVEILRRTSTDPNSDPHVLAMIERQLTHLVRLLDDLLDVNRISRGKIALRVEAVDLRQIAEAALEATGPLIQQMGHELVVSQPPEPVPVTGDPVRLAQVVANLLNNAAKYTSPGGRIALTVRRDGGVAELSVVDNGIGIPRGRLQDIFGMFTQIESPSGRSQGGLGIGLALVKGLVSLHGGAIEAFSDGLGHGSEFRVRLPVRLAAPEAPAPAGDAAHAAIKLRVLIADDNRDAASSLSMLLQLVGHEVRTAYDGETAVRLATEFRPDAVLLDLGMPAVDGYEACRRIRRQPGGERMRLIAVTGWGQEDDKRKSAAAGFDAHLVKPVNPETLLRALASCARESDSL